MPRASGHTRAIAPLRLLAVTLVFCVSVVGVARPAWAGGATNYTYTVLFDTDNSPATGCNVPVADKTVSTTFLGAERLVTVTVMRTGTGGIVTGITAQSCVNGAFGAAQPVSPGGWPVGKGDGVGGGDVIEGFVPATVLGIGGPMRVAFTASGATPGSDVMLSTADGGPILFALPFQVPALSTSGLALSVLPIHAMTIPVTTTPFTLPRSPQDAIPAAVPAALRGAIENVFAELSVPASVAGNVQLADQSGGVIFKVTIAAGWQQ